MRNVLTLMLLAACDDGKATDTDPGDARCSAEVESAIDKLNVTDSQYTDPEQILTDFVCTETCTISGDGPCLDSPSSCPGSDEVEYPYLDSRNGPGDCVLWQDEAADTGGETDPWLLYGGAQVLGAKLGLIESLAGRAPEFCVDAGLLPVCETVAAASSTAGPVPPPTGSGPGVSPAADLTACQAAVASANAVSTQIVFSISQPPEIKVNYAQAALNPAATGCWVRAAPSVSADPNVVWFAALYGIVNFGTGAVVQFNPCGTATVPTPLQVITVSKMQVAVLPTVPGATGASAQDIILWLDDPASVSPSVLAALNGKITVTQINFSQGSTLYQWTSASTGSTKWASRSPTSTTWTLNVPGPAWGSCSAVAPFTIDAGVSPRPFSIIDPAGFEDMVDLDTAADFLFSGASGLEFAFDRG